MIVSVSAETEAELIQAARRYADESAADLGLAFITEFERTPRTAHRASAVWCHMEAVASILNATFPI